MELRQSTEAKVRIGPFVDVTNGYEPETGITLGAADEAELLKQNGVATVDISGATWSAVASCDGWYDLTLTTSYTDTLGHITVVVQDDSVCLPVFVHFEVVTQNYYDSKYSTDILEVDLTYIHGTALTETAGQLAAGFIKVFDVATPVFTAESVNQSANNNTILAHTDYGLAKLVRSTTPANTLDINAAHEAEADIIKISGDATAADNLEATYDGTGYAEDSAPSTQEQVGRLTSGTAAINTTAESFTKSGAEPETNTYTSTVALDGTYHIVEDIVATGVTDAYYQFDVGGDGTPVSITWQGYARSQGDSYGIYAYKYSTSTYEQIGTISATNITTLREESFLLTNAHVGSGKVRFRFLSADGTEFATDRILCSYAIVVKTAGYSDGAIWINTLNSNTNTENYVDGTSDNPVSTWTAAKTLSNNLGIKKFHVVNGSTLTMDASCDKFTFVGNEWTIALGGQSFENTHIEEATVSGIGTAGSGQIHFRRCLIGGVTLGKSKFNSCGFNGTNTASAAETYIFDRCYNAADGSTPPIFDFGGAIGNTHGAFRNWQGGIEVANVGTNGTDVFTVTGRGRVVIASTCAGGTIKIIGDFTITDNVVGGFSGTLSEDARYDVDQINEQVDLALNTAVPGSPTSNSINERIKAVDDLTQASGDGDLAAVLVDTNELQTDWVNGGRLDLLLDACALEATVVALNNISASDVNSQVVDVLKTDTTSEMSQGAPPATPTFEEMVAYLYFVLRNKRITTSSEDAIYDNAGTTKLFKSTISDDGETFIKTEYGSGA